MLPFRFENGQYVRDTLTGVQGVVLHRIDFITGCNQYGIQPDMKKGATEIPQNYQIDENRLELVKGKKQYKLPEQPAAKKSEKVKPPGGPATRIRHQQPRI